MSWISYEQERSNPEPQNAPERRLKFVHPNFWVKVKGKVHPRTGHEGPEGE